MSTILTRSHLDALRAYLAVADSTAASAQASAPASASAPAASDTDVIRSLATRVESLLDGAPLDAGDGTEALLTSRDVEVLTGLGDAGGPPLLEVRDAVFYALVVAGRRKERRQSGARRWPSRRESTPVAEHDGD